MAQRDFTFGLVLIMICICIPSASAEIEFLLEPKDQAIVYGQDLFLHCSAVNITGSSGTSNGLQIQWRLNGSPLTEKASMFSNYTLLVPRVNEIDLGNYSCVVMNKAETIILESSSAEVSHAFIKMFELNPTPVNALEDETVSFDCITGESSPPPLVFWERNGEPFYGGNQYNATYGGAGTLTLVRQYSMKLMLVAKPYLDGVYNCLARNPVLNIDVRSLKVQMITRERETPPYVMEEMAITGVTTPLEQPMVIDCPITGKPKVTISWFVNGSSVDNFDAFLVLQNGSLHSPRAKLDDAGWYYCEGENALGIARSPNITVIIARLDFDFIRQPQDLYSIAGLPATISCIPPISVPPAYVVWYKDDALLVPHSGVLSLRIVQSPTGAWNIEFAEVQKEDEGEYFCVANNDYAVPSTRTSRVAILKVGGAPIFIQPPAGLTVRKGELARLVCYVQGDPFPVVTWFLENTVVQISEYVSLREQNQELWIGNIHKGFEGTYTCRAANRYGTTETKVYVKVLVSPVILVPVGHTIASANDATIIPCSVYSDPTPQITWYKDGAALMMGGRFTQLEDGLYITSVEPEDTGNYICEARNIAGSVESSGTLSIQVTPHFITKPKNQVVTVGRNVTLACAANGFPKPTITWLFNGSSLFPQDSLLTLNGESLFLLEVSWIHVGEYTCQAENIEGINTVSAMLKLQIPPKVVKIEGIPLLYQEEELKLKCLVTGIPTPMIEWQKNREPIRATQNGRISFPEDNTLRIQFVSVDDTGLYTCKVTNPAGVSQRDLPVHIIVRPSPPVLYKAETVSATSIELSWSIEQEQPQTPVDHVLIYYRKKIESILQQHRTEIPAAVLQYELKDLEPASEYIFMVAAVNEAGESDVSNILSARTFDAGPSEPRNLQTVAVTAHNITLDWEVPLITNGQIRRYQIQYWERTTPSDKSKLTVSSTGEANQSKLVPGLNPYTWYNFQVRGATMEGDEVLWGNWSEVVEVKTQQSAPTGRPREVTATALSSDTIRVTWEAVMQEKQNGPIKRYHVRCWLLSNMSIPVAEEVIDSLDLRISISGLDPWTWYSVNVYAVNDAGEGLHSRHISVRTLPTAPSGAPVNVTVEALSSTSLRLSWLSPPVEHWNSDLSGYSIEYWKSAEDQSIKVRVEGQTQLSYEIRGLDVWSDYEMRVAAYTTQLTDGVGPYSENVTGKTRESAPGIISDLRFTSAVTTVSLSWQPPAVTNGVVQEYLIRYFSMGSSVVTTPAPLGDISLMVNYTADLFSDSFIMRDIFNSIQKELTIDSLENIMEMCIYILGNETVTEILETDEDFDTAERIFQSHNVSDVIADWFINENETVLEICEKLKTAAGQVAQEDENTGIIPSPVLLIRKTQETQIQLTDLADQHIYNISVAAATEAGYGEPVFVQVATLKATTTMKPPTTKSPVVTRKTTTTERVTGLGQTKEDSLNMPAVIGGAVSGMVVLLMIFLVLVCLFIRRWRSDSEEKVRVISSRSQAYDNMYGQLDRPRSSQLASAAEDGTDTSSRLSESVDIYPSRVRYQSPTRSSGQGSDSSFVTDQSGLPVNRSQHRQEAFLGVDNPSYSGLDPPGTVKRNPTYLEEPSGSDMESMSVTMTLSAEDLISQGESTLKRKSRMKSSDAAAIARLRSSNNPVMSEQDTSSLIHNEVEVVYNERTAL